MPRNKGISTIQAIKCRTVEIPFFVISETNQPLCSVGVENTDLLSVGREYRLAVLARRVEDTEVKFDKFSNCYFDFESEDFDIVVNGKRSRSSAAATKLSLTQRWQLPCTSICPKKANTVLEYC